MTQDRQIHVHMLLCQGHVPSIIQFSMMEYKMFTNVHLVDNGTKQ